MNASYLSAGMASLLAFRSRTDTPAGYAALEHILSGTASGKHSRIERRAEDALRAASSIAAPSNGHELEGLTDALLYVRARMAAYTAQAETQASALGREMRWVEGNYAAREARVRDDAAQGRRGPAIEQRRRSLRTLERQYDRVSGRVAAHEEYAGSVMGKMHRLEEMLDLRRTQAIAALARGDIPAPRRQSPLARLSDVLDGKASYSRETRSFSDKRRNSYDSRLRDINMALNDAEGMGPFRYEQLDDLRVARDRLVKGAYIAKKASEDAAFSRRRDMLVQRIDLYLKTQRQLLGLDDRGERPATQTMYRAHTGDVVIGRRRPSWVGKAKAAAAALLVGVGMWMYGSHESAPREPVGGAPAAHMRAPPSDAYRISSMREVVPAAYMVAAAKP